METKWLAVEKVIAGMIQSMVSGLVVIPAACAFGRRREPVQRAHHRCRCSTARGARWRRSGRGRRRRRRSRGCPARSSSRCVAQRLAQGGTVDAVICLGAVIRGDTPHFDYVAGEAARGPPARPRSRPACPVVFGVLTTDTLAPGDGPRSAGSRATRARRRRVTALEMVGLAPSAPTASD